MPWTSELAQFPTPTIAILILPILTSANALEFKGKEIHVERELK
jgi:hypothetical protein